MLKLFGDNLKTLEADPAERVRRLFYEKRVIESYIPSQFISPSGMGCPYACAFKINGVPVPEGSASFYDESAANAGSDRHERIQSFLSKTPYWVDVADYIAKRPELDVRVVTHAEQVADWRIKMEQKKQQLELIPITGDVIHQWREVSDWLKKPDEEHIKEFAMQNRYEVLLVHTKYPIRFRCDGMLRIDGKFYILEIKTERQNKNNFRTGPADNHAKQGITYEMSLKPDGGIIWVYEGRDSMEPKTFLQLPDSTACAQNEAYITNILNNRETPWLLEEPPANACTYCEYIKYCKGERKKWKQSYPLQI